MRHDMQGVLVFVPMNLMQSNSKYLLCLSIQYFKQVAACSTAMSKINIFSLLLKLSATY